MKIIPGVLKELLSHVPTVLFQATDWSALASELPKLSRRLIQREGYTELFRHHSEFLIPFEINLEQSLDNKNSSPLPPESAEKVLTLYFCQLFSSKGLFIDLRPSHLDFKQGKLFWNPTGLWTKFSEEFRQGIIKIYDGFYGDNDQLFQAGLIEIGLASSHWSPKDLAKLGDLFRAHFSSSSIEEMVFDLDTFKDSLMEITHFLLEKKVIISNDFLYLGIYLVTFYSSMEQTKAPINVKATYFKVREQFQKI
jgi:predicted unusual protein kinase regulating ubiquinone biosynthesis (AarF/ABC1/UbiB family)